MFDNLGGFYQWDIAWFTRCWWGGHELLFDKPVRMRWSRPDRSAVLQMFPGGHVHQGFYFGGNIPVSLRPCSFELGFQVDSKIEMRRIQRLMALVQHEPQEFCPMVRIEDFWHIRSAVPGSTSWYLSRNTGYAFVDITDPEYAPVAAIDLTEQDVQTTDSTPDEGEVYLVADASSYYAKTPDDLSGSGGKYLSVEYVPMFLINKASVDDDVSEEDEWLLTVNLEEHVPNRIYTFSAPT